MGILPRCSYVSATIWLHHFDYNEALGEKKLHVNNKKNAVWCFELVLETAPNRSCTASYLWSHKLSKKNEPDVSDVLLWTPTHGHTSVGWPAKTWIHQLCMDPGCCLEGLPNAIANRNWWMTKESLRNLQCWHAMIIMK